MLDISDCYEGILIEDGAILNNYGSIYVDEINQDAIAMSSESIFPTFNNYAAGIININQRNSSSCRYGLNIDEGNFNNTGGRINMDGTNSTSASKAIELSNGSTFTNEAGGIINMGELTNNIGQAAIGIFEGGFVNSSCAGIINHSTEDRIVVADYTTGNFTNIGWIQSYCNTNSEISNNIGSIVNYGSGTFVFNGGGNNPVIEPDPIYTHVWIGEEDGDWTNLCNWASETLPNDTSQVWVERKLSNPTLTDDVQVQGLGISGVNTSGLTINPGVTLTVDGSPGAGVLVEGDLVNNGTLKITSTTGAGLQVSNSITLGGKTYIGETGIIGGAGIHTDAGATLDIDLCAEVYVYKQLTIDGNLNNEGLLWVNTTATHSGAITNDGVLNFPVGSSGLTTTNNDLIISPFDLEGCSVSDVLSIGGSNDFTPATTWYSDEAKTNVLGTYNTVTNTLDITGSPIVGTQPVYFTVSGNGCSFDVQSHYIANDTIVWKGTVSDEWTEPCNWSRAVVPTATDKVLIPDQTNDPVIQSGDTARAQSITISSSAQLTILGGGKLVVENSEDAGIVNQGTIDCQFNGRLDISNTAGNAIYNGAAGTINNRGIINITEPDGHGIENVNGTINNNANGTFNITMEEAPAGKHGIQLTSGNFFNNADANIFPVNANGYNINISNGVLTNEGVIQMIGDFNVGSAATLHTIVNSSLQYGRIIVYEGTALLDGALNATINYSPTGNNTIPFINSADSTVGSFATDNLTDFWSLDYSGTGQVALVYDYCASQPLLTSQPISETACLGDSVTFSVTTSASGGNIFQIWHKDGAQIPGATSTSLTLDSLAAEDAADYTFFIINFANNCVETSDTATLTVLSGMSTSISAQPASDTVCPGESVIFLVTAEGEALTYQWKKDGVDIPGANADSLLLAAVDAADAADYTCLVTGTCGEMTSSAATLTVRTATAITSQPAAASICPGEPVTFSVTAEGENLTYQWKKDGIDIPGANTSSLTLSNISAADAADYICLIMGACGSVSSSPATLTVSEALDCVPCVDGLVIDYLISESVILRSGDTLTASSIIDANADATFTAADALLFQSGFTVEAGGTLNAFIATCTFGSALERKSDSHMAAQKDDSATHQDVDRLGVDIASSPRDRDIVLELFIPEASTFTLSIIDSSGEILHKQEYPQTEPGWKSIQFQPGNLPIGDYILLIKTKNYSTQEPLYLGGN